MTDQIPNPEKDLRKAAATSSSFVLALVVLASMSGPLGAPRSLCLAASTIGRTAGTLQVTFLALASREHVTAEREITTSGRYVRPSAVLSCAALGAPAMDASSGHVRTRTDLPPPMIG